MKVQYIYNYEYDRNDPKQTEINKRLASNSEGNSFVLIYAVSFFGFVFAVFTITDYPLFIVPLAVIIYLIYKKITSEEYQRNKEINKRIESRILGISERLKIDKIPSYDSLEKKYNSGKITERELDALEIKKLQKKMNCSSDDYQKFSALYFDVKHKINIFENKYLGENNPLGYIKYENENNNVVSDKTIYKKTNPEIIEVNKKSTDSKEKTEDNQSKAKFCRYCGAKLYEDSLFCSNCGKRIVINKK